jgi:hypothetical protein
MLKGKSILEDPAALGVATETAVLKHLYSTISMLSQDLGIAAPHLRPLIAPLYSWLSF